MTIILDDLKLITELDDTDMYDDLLMRYANSGLRALKNAGIPVGQISKTSDSLSFVNLKADDYSEVIDWLGYYVLMRFDRKLDKSSAATIKTIMNDIRSRLQTFYDLPSVNSETEQTALLERLNALESNVSDIQSNQISVEDL